MKRLPHEIMANILSRLNMGCLQRCRYVCKAWYTIVSHPLYLNRSPQRQTITNSFVLHCTCDTDSDKPLCLLDLEEGKKGHIYNLPSFKHLEFPLTLHLSTGSWISQSILVGSCCGLLCLSSIDIHPDCNIPRNPIYVHNPITGEHQQLPEVASLQCNKVFSGFGFDDSRKDFKVVFVLFYKESGGLRSEVLIHTLGSSIWRRRVCNVADVLFLGLQVNSAALVNGSLHWLTMYRLEGNASNSSNFWPVIVAFHVGSEEFKTVPTPKQLVRSTQAECALKHYSLGEVDGCLTLVDCSSEQLLDIWSMKTYNVHESWVKMLTLQRKTVCSSPSQCFLLVKVRKNGDVLLLHDENFLVYCRNKLGVGDMKELQCFKNKKLGKTSMQVYPHKLSLISPRLACGL